MPKSANFKFTICLLTLFLLCSHPTILLANNLKGKASRYVTRISPTEGLSQSYVTKTVQDKDGFVWVGTQMGLNRYDGYKVKHIKGPNKVFEKEKIVLIVKIDKRPRVYNK